MYDLPAKMNLISQLPLRLSGQMLAIDFSVCNPYAVIAHVDRHGSGISFAVLSTCKGLYALKLRREFVEVQWL